MRPDQDLIDDFHSGKCNPEQACLVMAWLLEQAEQDASMEDWVSVAAKGEYPAALPEVMLGVIRDLTFGGKDGAVDRQGAESGRRDELMAQLDDGVTGGAFGSQVIVGDAGMSAENGPVIRPATRRLSWWRMAVAACVLLVAGICLLILQLRGRHSGLVFEAPVVAARAGVAAPKVPWKVFQAPAGSPAAPSSLQLADGSVVILSPGAVLRYDAASFNKRDRTLFLQGEGRFTVAADKSRPFSVIAGAFTTTALGTSFMVTTTAAELIRVRLYSGKVVVRQTASGQMPGAMSGASPVKDLYLRPGEEWAYDQRLHLPVISRFEHLPSKVMLAALPRKDIRKSGDTLIFDNASLSDVLKLLQRRYGVTIHADRKLLSDAYFTGQILPGDAIELILRTVTRMNNLTLIAAADDSFIIQ